MHTRLPNEQPCCYAQSDKYWVTDPSGIACETFHTLGNIPVYGKDTAVCDHGTSIVPVQGSGSPCCMPTPQVEPAASRCAK